MELCHICNKQFTHINGIISHYKKEHQYNHLDAIKLIKYYNNNIDFPKCPICGNDCSFRGKNRYIELNKTCGNLECVRLLNIESQKNFWNMHPEYKEKLRQNRINYLKDKQHFEKTAWGSESA